MYRLALWLASIAIAAASSIPARADPVADFYRGKTLTLLSGFSPSGENDTQLRMVGRFLPRHLPGQPTVIVSNMAGAGTLIAANHLYAKGAADGTMVGMFTAQVAVDPFLGNKTAAFDPLRFGWIGSITHERQFCGVKPGADVPTSFEELRRKETVFGSSGAGSDLQRLTQIMVNVLGAKIRPVTGYTGMPPALLAMQRGEVSGVCGFSSLALRTNLAAALADGSLKLLVQMGRTPTQEFGKVPSVLEFARNDGERALLEFFFRDLTIGRPIAAPPGVPAERLAALRNGLASVLKDPEFLTDAKKLNLVLEPLTGAEIEAQMLKISKYPPDLFQKVRAVFE